MSDMDVHDLIKLVCVLVTCASTIGVVCILNKVSGRLLRTVMELKSLMHGVLMQRRIESGSGDTDLGGVVTAIGKDERPVE